MTPEPKQGPQAGLKLNIEMHGKKFKFFISKTKVAELLANIYKKACYIWKILNVKIVTIHKSWGPRRGSE